METPASTGHKDRKTGLIIFGIIHILIGGMCALFCPLTLLSLLAVAATDPSNALPLGQALIGVSFYALCAVWCIWIGIGSIKTRRWARALVVTTSWSMIACGSAGLLGWIIICPGIYDSMAASGDMPEFAIAIAKAVTTIFMVVVYIIWPGILVAFYGSRHTKATCETLDPKTRWTDRCPLPVLAISLMLAVGSASMISLAAYDFALPVFGVIVSGPIGALISIGTMALLAYLAIGLYKLKMEAWWTATGLYLLFCISALITFQTIDLIDYYQAMGFNEQQLSLMRDMDFMKGPGFTIMILSYAIAWVGYMIYIKRFFGAGSEDPRILVTGTNERTA